jgi:hypothetical protein
VDDDEAKGSTSDENSDGSEAPEDYQLEEQVVKISDLAFATQHLFCGLRRAVERRLGASEFEIGPTREMLVVPPRQLQALSERPRRQSAARSASRRGFKKLSSSGALAKRV